MFYFNIVFGLQRLHFIYLSTTIMVNRKCILLYFVAITSTVICLIIVAAPVIVGNVGIYISIFDQMVNALCLYLQFGFTKRIYMKCCKYPDLCCRDCISWRMKRWQKRMHKSSPSGPSVASNQTLNPNVVQMAVPEDSVLEESAKARMGTGTAL